MTEPQVGSEYIVNGPPLDPRNGTKATVTEKRSADMWRVRFDDGVYGLAFTDELTPVPEPIYQFVVVTFPGTESGAGSLYFEGTDPDTVANERLSKVAASWAPTLIGETMLVIRISDQIIPHTYTYTVRGGPGWLYAVRNR